jgi:hypothetical protein
LLLPFAAGLKIDGSAESVESTMAQYTLQTYLDQVNTYQSLLRPIENIMKRTLGGAPDDENTHKSFGFGDVGSELPAALQQMGAVPNWEEDNSLSGNDVNNVVRGRRVFDTVKEMRKEREKQDNIQLKLRQVREEREMRKSLHIKNDFTSPRDIIMDRQGVRTFADIDGDVSITAAVSESTPRGASSPRNELGPVRGRGGSSLIITRRPKKPKPRTSAVIPWALLDELEGEKTRFANERTYFEYQNKFMQKP